MSKNIAKNYLYNMAYQILKILIPLITTPYLARVLGAEATGIYSYTLSITTYFVLFGTLGIPLYGQRETAYLQSDIKKRSLVFWEITILRLITMIISTVVFYITFCNGDMYQTYYKIFLLELFANIIDVSWYFQGLEEFKKTVTRNTIVKVISTVLIFVLIKDKNDLNKYIFIYVLSNCLGNLSLWLYLKKSLIKIKLSDINILKHLKPTLVLFIPQIAIQVYTVLDKTMIGALVPDKAETGYYEQAEKIIKLLMTIITAISTVMVPRVANEFSKGKKDKVVQYIKQSLQLVCFLGLPMMLGVILISKNFVPLFFGNGYDKVSNLMNVLSVIIIFIGFSNVIGNQYLIATKKQKGYTISVMIGALVNLVFNLMLIRLFKSIGAAIATVIAELMVTVIQFNYAKADISIKDVVKSSFNYVIASVLMFIIGLIIGCININKVLLMALQICICVVVYILYLYIVKDEFLIKIINALKFRLRRIFNNV